MKKRPLMLGSDNTTAMVQLYPGKTSKRQPRFEIWPGLGRQKWRWRLLAGNGKIIASGEGYASHSNVRRAVDTIQKAASVARISDRKRWP